MSGRARGRSRGRARGAGQESDLGIRPGAVEGSMPKVCVEILLVFKKKKKTTKKP